MYDDSFWGQEILGTSDLVNLLYQTFLESDTEITKQEVEILS
jgi:hypothetical protein